MLPTATSLVETRKSDMEPGQDCRVGKGVPEHDFGEKILGLGGLCAAALRINVMVKQETTQTSPWAVRHHCVQELGQPVLHIPVGSDCALRVQWHTDHMSSPGHENGEHLLRCIALPSTLDW